MKQIQNKIISLTEKYIRVHYDEYTKVCESIQNSREIQKDEFASTGQDSSYLQQLSTIIPETLDNLFQEGLKEEEWLYYKSIEGTRWFAKRFKEFSPATKI